MKIFLCLAWTTPVMRGGEHLVESPNSQFSRQLNRKSTLNCSGGGLVDVLKQPVLNMRLFACNPSFACSANKSLKRKISKEAIRREKGESQMFAVLKQCGWYYENLNACDSENLLRNSQIGTFLLRRSSSPQHQFSLTVQTPKGPASVRLHNIGSFFQLQAQSHLQDLMPAFRSVIDLVEFYCAGRIDCIAPAWVNNDGALHSPIILEKPFKKEPLSLKHLSRLTVQQNVLRTPKHRTGVGSHLYKKMELPSSLVIYLEEYPHTI